jgi:uncharacterized protein involved in exopolysaccharide biosynthesis
MEEYEVDLRDYLRVIWERKWIIVGIFAISVVAAGIFSYRLLDEYEVKALVQLEPPPANPLATPAIRTLDINTVNQLLRSISPEIRISSVSSDSLTLALRGTPSPQLLSQQLAGVIDTVQKLLRDQIRGALAWQVAVLQQFTEQEEGALAERQQTLEHQLQLLLDIPRSSETLNQAAQAQMIVLMGQLQALYHTLYQRQLETQRTLAAYRELLASDWEPLRLLHGPQGSSTPIGPPRRLHVAIAGALGLLVGLLFAFVVHHLQSASPPRGGEPISPEARPP